MAFIPWLIVAVVYAIGFSDAAHQHCHVCNNVCGNYADLNELDRQCNYDQGGSENCQNGCFTEITCNPDGSGEVCITKRCTVPNNVCVRSREFYPVVWAGPEEVSTCSVSECCKRDYCNEYSGRELDATLRACCPDCNKCPVDLIFVVDVSGSIPNFTDVVDYMKVVIPQFNPFLVRLGVVCFGREADTIVHLGGATNNLVSLLIDALREGHVLSTDIAAGIDEMAKEFMDHALGVPYTDLLGVVITDGGDSNPTLGDTITNAKNALLNLSLVSVISSRDYEEDILDLIGNDMYDLSDPQALLDHVDGLLPCH